MNELNTTYNREHHDKTKIYITDEHNIIQFIYDIPKTQHEKEQQANHLIKKLMDIHNAQHNETNEHKNAQ